jgi:hypothetical protein
MINPIRTEVKKNANSLTLPSLTEVIKPILGQDNQPMYPTNNMMPYPKSSPFPTGPLSPQSSRIPSPKPIGALHSLLNPLPPGGKQSNPNS